MLNDQIIFNNECKFITVCTSAVEKYKIKERLDCFDIETCTEEKLANLSPKIFREVGWNVSYFVNCSLKPNKKIITKELGPCVGVLLRCYNKLDEITHLGLIHLFSDSEELFNNFWKKAVEATPEGRIEIFIGGGKPSSQGSREHRIAIYKTVSSFESPSTTAKIVHNLFGLADIGEFYLCTDKAMYTGNVGIKMMGFTNENKPFLVVDAKVTGYEVGKTEVIKKIIFERN